MNIAQLLVEYGPEIISAACGLAAGAKLAALRAARAKKREAVKRVLRAVTAPKSK